MVSSDSNAANNAADNNAKSEPVSDVITSSLLSELPLRGSSLFFGLNFKYTKVSKSGLINRFKDNKEAMDIDLSCIVFNKELAVLDTVWFKKLRDSSGAVRHQGDSINGKDRGSDAELNQNIDVESIEIRLPRLPENVHHLALIVSSFNNHALKQISRGYVHIGNDEGNEVYSFDLTRLEDSSSALCVALLTRELGEWRFTIKNLSLKNANMDQMTSNVRAELTRLYG